MKVNILKVYLLTNLLLLCLPQITEKTNKEKSEDTLNSPNNEETVKTNTNTNISDSNKVESNKGKSIEDDNDPEEEEKLRREQINIEDYEQISTGKPYNKKPKSEKTHEIDAYDQLWEENISSFSPKHLYAFQILRSESFSVYQRIKSSTVITIAFYVHEEDQTVNFTILDPTKKIIYKIQKRNKLFYKIDAVRGGNYQLIFSRVRIYM